MYSADIESVTVVPNIDIIVYVYFLVHDYDIQYPITSTLEILHFCTKPSIYISMIHVCFQTQEHELKPGGADIPVTEENKRDYIG